LAIGIYKVGEIPSPDALDSKSAHLFVANHRSWIDGLLLLALIPNVRIPVNVGYLKAPLVGRIMIWLGCIPLDRKSAETTLRGVEEIRESVRSGTAVAVFPEGTRSPKGRLGQFSGFFFRVACEENTSIQPIVLHTDYPFLGPGAENFLTARRAILTIRLLDPIAPKKGERGPELSRRVHKAMAPVLLELDRL
jgi:1-acyl-sn-glycerol-3-phosphate acyltransferase